MKWALKVLLGIMLFCPLQVFAKTTPPPICKCVKRAKGVWSYTMDRFTMLGAGVFTFRVILTAPNGKKYISKTLSTNNLPNTLTMNLKKPPAGIYMVAIELLTLDFPGVVIFRTLLTNNQNSSRYYFEANSLTAELNNIGFQSPITQFAIPE